jgi:hypothetical protein
MSFVSSYLYDAQMAALMLGLGDYADLSLIAVTRRRDTLAAMRKTVVNSLMPAVLALAVAWVALPCFANAPEPTYAQTRDWIVATINESAGYTRDATTVTYKDVSMDGCHLRFTTSTFAAGYTDTDIFTVSLDSIKSIIWGTASNPQRGYVIFTATTPINFDRQRVWRALERQPQNTNAATTIAYLEFGKPGIDYSDVASRMKAAILHAADLCKVQLAAK